MDDLRQTGSRGDGTGGKEPRKSNLARDGYEVLDRDEGFGRKGLSPPVHHTDLYRFRRP